MAKTNRYKQLFSFTLILGIGTVISKLMTYVVLTPLYTRYLTPDEFGIVELVVQTANLLMPLVSLGINQAVLRFGMDGNRPRLGADSRTCRQSYRFSGFPFVLSAGAYDPRIWRARLVGISLHFLFHHPLPVCLLRQEYASG